MKPLFFGTALLLAGCAPAVHTIRPEVFGPVTYGDGGEPAASTETVHVPGPEVLLEGLRIETSYDISGDSDMTMHGGAIRWKWFSAAVEHPTTWHGRLWYGSLYYLERVWWWFRYKGGKEAGLIFLVLVGVWFRRRKTDATKEERP